MVWTNREIHEKIDRIQELKDAGLNTPRMFYLKKFADPIIGNIKQSLTNREIRKILCAMFSVKTARKFKLNKPQEFEILTQMFGDVWGL